jgi:hypothetical protein
VTAAPSDAAAAGASAPAGDPGDVDGGDGAWRGVLPRLTRWTAWAWAALLVAIAVESLRWPLIRDAPLMEYVAWSVRRGSVPYRDVFDMNLPGTYATHVVGQVLGGTSALHVRLLDLVVLGLGAVGVHRLTRPFGPIAARSSSLLLAFTALVVGGPELALQRDWLVAIASLWAVVLVLSPAATRRWVRALGAGALAGYATMVKPTAALVVGVLVVVLVARARAGDDEPTGAPDGAGAPERSWRAAARAALPEAAAVGAGAAIVVVALMAWIVWLGGGSSLRWMWSNYFPLYARLDGSGMEVGSLGAHVAEVVRRVASTATTDLLLLVPSLGVVALFVRPRPGALSRRLAAIALLGAVGIVSLVSTPRVWDYYWWPWNVAAIAMVGVLVQDVAGRAGERRGWRVASGAVVAALGVATVLSALCLVRPWDERPYVTEHVAAVDEISAALRERAGPGDEVQVLDTTVGGVQAALAASLPPATPFIYDFHFFHDVDDPAVQTLRRRLIDGLERSEPRLVVVARRSWSHRRTMADLASFPELATFLDDYRPVVSNDQLVLLERR